MAQPPRHQEESIRGTRRASHHCPQGPQQGAGTTSAKLGDFTDIFNYGLDSLQVLQLSQLLNRSRLKCTARMVYESPTIENLVEAVNPKEDSPLRSPSPLSREERMSAMFHRCFRFEARPLNCVLLIGSTEGLEKHLHQLMLDISIDGIYCLNGSLDAPYRQMQSFSGRGLGNVNVHAHPKVLSLQGDISQSQSGLTPLEFAEIMLYVNAIILNAWPVNFSRLESIEGVMSGTKRCADFAAASPRRPRIVLISSIASVLNYPAVCGGEDQESVEVPEEFDPDNSLPARQGYGESKHVASCILEKVVRNAGIDVAILRLGQLAGAAEGKSVWNRHGKESGPLRQVEDEG